MCQKLIRLTCGVIFLICILTANGCSSNNMDQSNMDNIVGRAIQPIMDEYEIPGMAVAITIDGKRYFCNYGIASKETKHPITSKTIFEIGSISKIFTATLASYAQIEGKLSFTDSVTQYLPSLRGSSFDHINLMHLGTHTSGGLPLQVPDNINDTDQLMEYFKNWKPIYPAGTARSYSNLSIGLLGMAVATSMDEPFEFAVEKNLFSPLRMTNSYYQVPETRMDDYAQGYNKQNEPVRVNAGLLMSEAYGVRSCTSDLIHFIEANMGMITLDEKLQHAILNTHTGYYKAGEITQDLMWEQYSYPVSLKQLLDGNSSKMILQNMNATEIIPPSPPSKDVLINKTGSTNGFGAYAVFVPAKKVGIIILANKSYPNEARITAAYQILSQIIERRS